MTDHMFRYCFVKGDRRPGVHESVVAGHAASR
jgi:hypothetical protein